MLGPEVAAILPMEEMVGMSKSMVVLPLGFRALETMGETCQLRVAGQGKVEEDPSCTAQATVRRRAVVKKVVMTYNSGKDGVSGNIDVSTGTSSEEIADTLMLPLEEQMEEKVEEFNLLSAKATQV